MFKELTGYLFSGLLFVLQVVCTPDFAGATTLIVTHPEKQFDKVTFEQNTGVIVWDVGSQRGVVDRDDDLTDLDQACTIADSSIIPDPVQIMASKKAAPLNPLHQSVPQILEKFGVSAGNFKMTPVAAFVGKVDEPVFLLFPEKHINNPVKQELGELHESLAKDTLKLTTVLDRQDIKILNTMEGPQGPWASEFALSPKTLNERVGAAYKLMTTKWISGGQLVGEVYGDKVLTHNNDDNDLAIQYAIALQAYVMSFEAKSDSNARWARAKAFLASKFPVRSRLVQVDRFRDFFEKTVERSSEEIKSISSQICEARSREMASYSYDLAKQQGARVVYMGFGALHAHGVIEQLRRYSASYIVFSPNF